MGKRNIKEEETNYPILRLRSYSVDEILAAGGATAFANKIGHDPRRLADLVKAIPEDARLTDEEVAAAIKMLKNSN